MSVVGQLEKLKGSAVDAIEDRVLIVDACNAQESGTAEAVDNVGLRVGGAGGPSQIRDLSIGLKAGEDIDLGEERMGVAHSIEVKQLVPRRMF